MESILEAQRGPTDPIPGWGLLSRSVRHGDLFMLPNTVLGKDGGPLGWAIGRVWTAYGLEPRDLPCCTSSPSWERSKKSSGFLWDSWMHE